MALVAERVVTELVADTRGHDVKILTSARVVDQAAVQIQRSATRMEQGANRALVSIAQGSERFGSRHVTSLQAQRAGMQQLSFQIGDVAQQFALGVPPMRIFVQQGGQVVQALQLMGGQSNAFLRFLGGPWGIGIGAAAAVLVPLIARLVDTRTEVEKAADELANSARQADATRQAHAAFERTLPGVTAAIRSETEALLEQNRTLGENQELVLQRARHRQTSAERLLGENIREQAAQRDLVNRLERTAGRNARGQIIESVDLRRAREELQRLVEENARIHTQIRNAADEIVQAEIPIARREAEALADPIAAINQRYDEMARAAERAAEGNRTLRESLSATLAQIERNRRSALDAERESRRDDRSAVRPATGAVLSQFGADRSGVPVNGRRVRGRSHQGVDIRGNVGDPVVAPEGGTAFVRNAPGGLGLYVEIRADSGARDLLAHLSRANIQSGQRVEAGQLVGLIGTSGNAQGGTPHLHWQRMMNRRWVDPMRSVGSSGAAQAAQAAQREAEERARHEAQFQDELRQLDAALLDARQRSVISAEERFALAQEELEAARLRQNATYEEAERQGRLTEAQRQALVAKNDEIFLQFRINAQLEEWQRLDEQRYRIAVEDLRDQQSIEQARGQFARTVAERRESELRLLELAHEEEIRAIERARLQEGLNDAERARLDRARAFAEERYGLARRGVEQRNMSPMQQFLDRAPQSAEELREALEQIQVDALRDLADETARATVNMLGLTGAIGSVAERLLRLAMDRGIVELLELLGVEGAGSEADKLARAGTEVAKGGAAVLAGAIALAAAADRLAAANAGGGAGGGKGGGTLGTILSLFNVAASTFAAAGAGAASGAGAGAAGAVSGIVGAASGATGIFGGRGGIDQNILSFNGKPFLRVGRGEHFAVTPQGKTLSAPSGQARRGGVGSSTYAVNVYASDAVLTHTVREWVREGMAEAVEIGSRSGHALTMRTAARRQRHTLS